MLAIAFNGSPRKNGNTAVLLKKALEGAASQGAETEFIQLNQLKMKGCQSCFSCMKRGGKSYGKCTQKDDMTPLYKKIEQADAVFLGTPIYFHSVTSEMKMLIDRLFPYYSMKTFTSNFPKKINAGLIFTMNVEDEIMQNLYSKYIKLYTYTFSFLFGHAEALISTDTFHVSDYSVLEADRFEQMAERKLKHKQEVFPADCQKAFDMGARFIKDGVIIPDK